tara:strand:+ start:807 stop:1418 length:612 start_codon:yes stop_codon:yes gene_type:complete
MKIIELYGYSGSGKTYLAKKIKSKKNLNDLFYIISKKKRIFRFLIKICYIFSINFDDLKFVISIQKEFNFLKIKYKLKNFFSFLYIIGFIRNNIKNKTSIIIDHGIFQCLFSCYSFSKKNRINHKKISFNLIKFFSKLPLNFNYHIICMKTDIKTIKDRLKVDKRFFQLSFLEKDEKKIKYTYRDLKLILQFISKRHKNLYIK